MTESELPAENEPRHWDSLAEELGAKPSAPSEPPPAKKVARPPFRVERAKEKDPGAGPKSADWDGLIQELGVEGVAPPTAKRPAAAWGESAVSPDQAEHALPAAPSAAPTPFQEPEEPEEAETEVVLASPAATTDDWIDFGEEGETSPSTAIESPTDASDEERGAVHPRRRRRRRRTSSREKDAAPAAVPSGRSFDRDERDETPPLEVDESHLVAEEPSFAELDGAELEDEPVASDSTKSRAAAAEKSADPEKRKRRRRRGGRKTRADAQSSDAQGSDARKGSAEKQPSAAHGKTPSEWDSDDELDDDLADVLDADLGPDLDADEDDESDSTEPRSTRDKSDSGRADGASRGVRGGHRNIPAWQDAVGVIVEANLQNRAKSGPSDSQRGRGRGRGRGRRK